ncbi:PAS domain S-box protein [Flavobacteriaceae bacterium R38]|nr:PAS domain S-box protein [Flavobacteriaceae bacterium R38]
MSKSEIEILKRALKREREARKQAEKILEDKSLELYELTEELQKANTKLEENISLKTSELKGVFENIVDAYVMIDLKGNVVKMNDAAVELLGYDITKAPFNLMNLLHKDDLKYTIRAFKILHKKGAFTDYQARIIAKNKEVKLVHVNSSIIYDKSGKAIAAQGIVRDITTETINKEIFEEQKKQLDIIVDNSSLGIVLTANGAIIKTNKTFEKLLGYSGEELLGKSVKELTFEDDKEETSEKMNVVDSGNKDDFIIKKRYVKKDTSLIDAKTIVNAIRDNQGKIKYQVAMIEDITSQLAIERQKEQLMENLAKSNEELQQYAHVVSHDLKSPLSSINAMVSWIKEDYKDLFDDQGLNYLKMLEDKLESMERLIDGILKYSSVNHDILIKKKVDVNEIVSEVIETIHIPDHITVSALKKLPVIKADRTRVLQLFQNIVTNAVNYIDKTKGVVEIDCESEHDYWIFSIKDNGQGIPEKYHTKIFKIFQSLGNEKSSTGIGLSIVKKIVDLYQGKIWLESEIGVGTTFYFTIKKN